LGGVAVHRGDNMLLHLHALRPCARVMAIDAARRASTPAILVLYSAVPRLSLIGRQAARAAASRAASAASSTLVPMSAAPSTGTSRRPFGPTTTATARAATMAGTLSAAGEALHRLPANDARP